jgi:adenylate cyclase, class 2
MTETEVKIRWDGPAAGAQALILGHGYRISAARTLEIDQLFDRPSGDLRQGGLVLRLRRSGGLSTVTYKGPAERETYKSREEIEFDVSDPKAFAAVLDRLGYQPGFRYEKYRTKYSDPDAPGLVTLDETPVGVYLELEGSKYWIDLAAQRLGFTSTDYITSSYAALYRQYREHHPDAPANMTFGLGTI